MSTVENSSMARASPVPRTELTARGPTPAPDAMSQKIREVSVNTEQVNSEIKKQRTVSAERMSELNSRIAEAIRTLNESAKMNTNKLQFSVDSVSNKVMVVVTDEVTGETVRQVPAEVILRVAHNIEAMKGLLFDKVL